MRQLVIAATDSHLKWAAHMAGRVPATWDQRIVVLESAIGPSSRQIAAATAGTGLERVESATVGDLRAALRRCPVDSVLLACPGPFIAGIEATVLRAIDRRPATAAVTPGIASPVRTRAMLARRDLDAVIVHSIAERVEHEAAFARLGVPTTVALARLPTLVAGVRSEARERRPVFVAQSEVPAEYTERRRLLRLLAAAYPDGVVVHLRSLDGERTAHVERDAYPAIWSDLVGSGAVADGVVEFVHGPMADWIARAPVVLTVSSTAALEAIAAGTPVGIVADLGMRSDLLNGVFAGSGLFVELERGPAAGDGRPREEWSRRHYFHDPGIDDWCDVLERIVDQGPRPHPGTTRRHWWPAAKWVVGAARPTIGVLGARSSA